MHRNPLWIAFLAIIWILALAMNWRAASKYWDYQSISQKTSAIEVQWSLPTDSYLQADYTYIVDGQPYSSQGPISTEPYLNRWAAERGLEEVRTLSLDVWYSQEDPAHSTLIRVFPTRELVYGLFSLLLAIYFLGLGIYVRRIS